MQSTWNPTGYGLSLPGNCSQFFFHHSDILFPSNQIGPTIAYWVLTIDTFFTFNKFGGKFVCAIGAEWYLWIHKLCVISIYVADKSNSNCPKSSRFIRNVCNDKLFAWTKFTLNDLDCSKHVAICAPFLISGRRRRSTLHPLLKRWPNRIFHYRKILNWILWVLCKACAGHKCTKCPVGCWLLGHGTACICHLSSTPDKMMDFFFFFLLRKPKIGAYRERYIYYYHISDAAWYA